MDTLSSMANISGYKGVLLAAVELNRYFPMLMTAAGMVREIARRVSRELERAVGGNMVMAEMRGLDGGEVAPPGEAESPPLRMQRLHRRVGAPERHAADDQTLAEAVEQFIAGGAAQSLLHRPDMRLDNTAAERLVILDGEIGQDRVGEAVALSSTPRAMPPCSFT